MAQNFEILNANLTVNADTKAASAAIKNLDKLSKISFGKIADSAQLVNKAVTSIDMLKPISRQLSMVEDVVNVFSKKVNQSITAAVTIPDRVKTAKAVRASLDTATKGRAQKTQADLLTAGVSAQLQNMFDKSTIDAQRYRNELKEINAELARIKKTAEYQSGKFTAGSQTGQDLKGANKRYKKLSAEIDTADSGKRRAVIAANEEAIARLDERIATTTANSLTQLDKGLRAVGEAGLTVTQRIGALQDVVTPINNMLKATIALGESNVSVAQKASNLREIMFGVADAATMESKSLRFLSNALDILGTGSARFNTINSEQQQNIVKNAQQQAQVSSDMVSKLQPIKEISKAIGVEVTSELSKVQAKLGTLNNEWERMRVHVEANDTGLARAAGSRVNQELEATRQILETIRITAGKDITPELEKHLQGLENDLLMADKALQFVNRDMTILEDNMQRAAKSNPFTRFLENSKELNTSVSGLGASIKQKDLSGIALGAIKSVKLLKETIIGVKPAINPIKEGMDETGKSVMRSRLEALKLNTSFKNVVTTAIQLNKFYNMGILAFVKISPLVSKLGFSLDNANKSAGFLSNTLSVMGGNLLASGVQKAMSTIGNTIGYVTGQFMQANNLVQNFNVTMKQMMSGYSTEIIDKSIQGANEFIREVIAKTPFELATGQEAFQKLVTAGFDPREWLMSAADAAAAMNKPMEQFTFAISRLKAGSKGMAVDMLRDFGIAVQQVGVWKNASGEAIKQQELFQDGVRLTEDQLKSSGYTFEQWAFNTAGSLEQGPNEALEILNGYLKQNEVFAGASAARSKTLTGVLSNLSDAVTTIVVGFGQPVFTAFTSILTSIYNLINTMLPTLEAFSIVIGQKIGTALQNFVYYLFGIKTGMEELAPGIFVAINSASLLEAKLISVGNTIIESIKPALYIIMSVINGEWKNAWGYALVVVNDAMTSIFDLLANYGYDAMSWGYDFISMVAEGIYSAASSILASAMNYVGSMISSYLEPHSPPKRGPLNSIDKWGALLMDVFGAGFQDTKVDLLTAILTPISDALAGSGKVKEFQDISNRLGAIIEEATTTGQFDSSSVDSMLNGIMSQEEIENTKKIIEEKAKLIRLQNELKIAQESGDYVAISNLKKQLADQQTIVSEQDTKMAAIQKLADLQTKIYEQETAGQNASAAAMDNAAKAMEKYQKTATDTYNEEKASLDTVYQAKLKSARGDKERLAVNEWYYGEKVKLEEKRLDDEDNTNKQGTANALAQYQRRLDGIRKLQAENLKQERLAEKLAGMEEPEPVTLTKPGETLAGFAADVTDTLKKSMEKVQQDFENGQILSWSTLTATFKRKFGEVFLGVPTSAELAANPEFMKLPGFKYGADSLSTTQQSTTSLIDSVLQYLDQEWPKIEKFLQEKIDALSTWMTGPEGVVTDFSTLLNGMIDSAGTWAEQPENKLKMQNLGASIVSTMFDLAYLTKNLLTVGKNIITSISSSLSTALFDNATSLSDIGADFLIGMINGGEGGTGYKLPESVKTAIHNSMSGMIEWAFTVVGILLSPKTAGERMGKIWAGVFDMGTSQPVKDAINKSISSIFTQAEPQVATGMALMSDQFAPGVMDIQGQFQTLDDELVGHSIIPDMVNEIVRWITDVMPSDITSWFNGGGLTTLLSGFVTLGTQAVSSFVTNFTANLPSLSSLFGGWTGGEGDTGGGIMSVISSLFGGGTADPATNPNAAMMATLQTTFSTFSGGMTTWVTTITGLWTTFTTNFYNYLFTAMTTIQPTVDNFGLIFNGILTDLGLIIADLILKFGNTDLAVTTLVDNTNTGIGENKSILESLIEVVGRVTLAYEKMAQAARDAAGAAGNTLGTTGLVAPAPLDSHKLGTDFIPKTGVYMLHRGEAVFTAKEAEQWRSIMRNMDGRQLVSTKMNNAMNATSSMVNNTKSANVTINANYQETKSPATIKDDVYTSLRLAGYGI